MLRVGVVGYGTGGRHFHTPFIDAAAAGLTIDDLEINKSTVERYIFDAILHLK